MRRGGRMFFPQAGLTLLEAVVSIAIVAVLSALLLAATGGSRRAAVVRQVAQEFAGFLRATEARALNGVKVPGCPLDDRDEALRCSEYTVTFVEDTPQYERDSRSLADVPETKTLPHGVLFGRGSPPETGLLFELDPPELIVSRRDTGGNFSRVLPGDTVSIPLVHAAGGTPWNVCVSGTGIVRVTAAAC